MLIYTNSPGLTGRVHGTSIMASVECRFDFDSLAWRDDTIVSRLPNLPDCLDALSWRFMVRRKRCSPVETWAAIVADVLPVVGNFSARTSRVHSVDAYLIGL